jgi:hypothetical protein
MTRYDDKILEPILPILTPGQKEHVLVPQDETTVYMRDGTEPGLKVTSNP